MTTLAINDIHMMKSFIWLDMITIKPYFRIKLLLIYLLMPLSLASMSGNILSGIGVGLLLGSMFLSYTFMAGEKCNIDALYATLSVNRKTVVTGRYLTILLINTCSIFFSTIIAAVGWFIIRIGSTDAVSTESIWSTMPITLIIILLQAICVPIYFKFGYMKAKYLVFIPIVSMMSAFAVYYIFYRNSEMGGSIATGIVHKIFFNTGFSNLNGGIVVIYSLIVIFMIAVIYISYKLSLFFYKNRDF